VPAIIMGSAGTSTSYLSLLTADNPVSGWSQLTKEWAFTHSR